MGALLQSLKDLHVPDYSAGIIDAQYSGVGKCQDFLTGLEIISRMIALKEIPDNDPTLADPWDDIYTKLLDKIKSGVEFETAWKDSLGSVKDPQMVIALNDAVNARTHDITDSQDAGNQKSKKTKDYIRYFTSLGYSVKLNQCNGKIEVNGEDLSDGLAAKIRCQMRDGGYKKDNIIMDVIETLAFQNQYHPVRDYLNSLHWDGHQWIADLADYFRDDYGMFPSLLRKFLIGSCAKVFEGAQNPMLVLDGPQNIGKSGFARWLCPIPDYFREGRINTDDKDNRMALACYWIWEVSELGATTRKADHESLKDFLTKRVVTERRSYGRHETTSLAMSSFIGTVNNESGFLTDTTGNRRFRICKLSEIRWEEYVALIDPAWVWAEAMTAYRAGESWDLEDKELDKAQKITDEYMIMSPVEEAVKQYFLIDPRNKVWFESYLDIRSILLDNLRGNLSTAEVTPRAIAAAMTKLGVTQERKFLNGQKIRGYTGVHRK